MFSKFFCNGIQVVNFFARFSRKNVWRFLKTNVTKFELYDLPFPKYNMLDGPLKRLFPLRFFVRIAIQKQNFKKLLHAFGSQ